MNIDKDEVKNNLSQIDNWLRGLFMVLVILAYNIAETIFIGLTIVQFFFVAITGRRSTDIEDFSKKVRDYIVTCLDYLRYESDEKPFPFGDISENKNIND